MGGRATLPDGAIGHRGARGLAPENTIAGVEVAKRHGCRWVEIDVRLTRDRVPVVIHDATLDRTTRGKGPVAEHDAREIVALDAGSWFDERFRGEAVPTLERLLARCGELGLGVVAELKDEPGREGETVAAVAPLVSGRRVLVSSFASALVERIAAAVPGVGRALLADRDPDTALAMGVELGCDQIHLADSIVTSGVVAAVRASGRQLCVYTVNDPRRARRLFSWGVAGVFTDRPDLVTDSRLR